MSATDDLRAHAKAALGGPATDLCDVCEVNAGRDGYCHGCALAVDAVQRAAIVEVRAEGTVRCVGARCSARCYQHGTCMPEKMVPAGNKVDPATAACDTQQANDERTT